MTGLELANAVSRNVMNGITPINSRYIRSRAVDDICSMYPDFDRSIAEKAWDMAGEIKGAAHWEALQALLEMAKEGLL
jgi:hypothetical protein